jgi:tetratricopeptide (TPR) repeat protein
MNTQVNELHSKAMIIAEAAFVAKRKGSHDEALRLSEEAFSYEHDAALLLLDQFEIEPTRSVLFRSAACLALDSGNYAEAEKMIAYGLEGNPPAEVKDELQDLLLDLRPVRSKPVAQGKAPMPKANSLKVKNLSDQHKHKKQLRSFNARKKLRVYKITSDEPRDYRLTVREPTDFEG